MKLPIKSASVRLYKVRYSRIILSLEITFLLMFFASLFVYRAELWFLPSLILSILLTYIFFSLYSVINQWPNGLTLEIRESTAQLIVHDGQSMSSFPIQKVNIRMTRWFVMLQTGTTSKHQTVTLFKDSFDDVNHYTSFRRNLILMQREVMQYDS